jgi:ADP-heptose:LPS heptosyltransferase
MARVLKRIERASRRLLTRLLRGPSQCAESDAPPPEPSSILVTRPDSRLGNLVLTLPLLEGLRSRFPEARLTLLASDRFAELPTLMGFDVIPVDKARMASHPWLFPGFARKLRKRGFDCAIDASHPFAFSLSGALVGRLAGARTRIGFASGDYEGWYTHAVPGLSKSDHESRTIHRLGSVWPRWPAYSPPLLRTPGRSRCRSIGVHVGASRGKVYPPDRFSRLVAGLAGIGRVILFWGSEGERNLAVRLAADAAASGLQTVTVSDPLSIAGLLDSFAGLDLLVTADNGPMHVAYALGTPVIALFRVQNHDRFGPLSEGSVVLYDPDGPDPERVIRAVKAVQAGIRP